MTKKMTGQLFEDAQRILGVDNDADMASLIGVYSDRELRDIKAGAKPKTIVIEDLVALLDAHADETNAIAFALESEVGK